jgi:archaellum component FlaC
MKSIFDRVNNFYNNVYKNSSKNRSEIVEFEHSLYDHMNNKIDNLEFKYQLLEQEYTNLVNDMYKIHNSLDTRIDIALSEIQKIRGTEP